LASFDDIKQKISDTAHGAVKGAKDFAEINRINSQISAAERKIDKAFIAIGEEIYQHSDVYLASDGVDYSPLLEPFAAIRDSQEAIEELREQAEGLKDARALPTRAAQDGLDGSMLTLIASNAALILLLLPKMLSAPGLAGLIGFIVDVKSDVWISFFYLARFFFGVLKYDSLFAIPMCIAGLFFALQIACLAMLAYSSYRMWKTQEPISLPYTMSAVFSALAIVVMIAVNIAANLQLGDLSYVMGNLIELRWTVYANLVLSLGVRFFCFPKNSQESGEGEELDSAA